MARNARGIRLLVNGMWHCWRCPVERTISAALLKGHQFVFESDLEFSQRLKSGFQGR
jgi:hypothetical protein